MAKSTRQPSPKSARQKTNTTSQKTNQPWIDPKQTAFGKVNRPVDLTGTGLSVDQGVVMPTNSIIIENTDDINHPLPGQGLIASRENRIAATLGKHSEMVSVVVQAYNRLEKTKICIECILKYTTDIEYELVLVDNGSTDGTLDYFKSVKHRHKKIIWVTKNIGSYVPIMHNQLSGRYLAFICNDTYVTQNWLINLLTCLKSDASIGMVVPVCFNASNFQGVDITFNTLDEMQAKAVKHNISNPGLWHERLSLVMQMVIFKREAMDIAGIGDYGYFYDFADDDLAFRYRRAGYKTMLCKDTFVHHDHIHTNSEEKDLELLRHSLMIGKKDFKSKHFGIDASDDVNNFESVLISLVNPLEQARSIESHGVEILGVDVLCGTPILELKNKLREARLFDTRLSAFSTNPKYWLDLKTICAGDVVADRIEHIYKHFLDMSFDYVILGTSLNDYQNPLHLLRVLLKRLKSDGHLLVKLHNTYDVLSLFNTLGANIHGNVYDNVYQLSINELIDFLKNVGFINNKIAAENWPSGEQDLQFLRNVITTTGFSQYPDEVFARAIVRDYVIDIVRK